MMESKTKLYALNFQEVKTYLLVVAFVLCNMVLPQLFHLVPQGGIIFAPLSLVILAGSYKFGWKVGLLAAILFAIGKPCRFWLARMGCVAGDGAEAGCPCISCRVDSPVFPPPVVAVAHWCCAGERAAWWAGRVVAHGRYRRNRCRLHHRMARAVAAGSWNLCLDKVSEVIQKSSNLFCSALVFS